MAANSKFAVATHIVTVLGHFSIDPNPKNVRLDGLVSSDVVASSVNTNPVLVRRILSQLAKAGVVVSHLGKQGGVKLARSADQITLLDIYCAIGEAPFFSQNPNDPNPICPVSCRIKSVIQPVFDDLTETVKYHLAKITLQYLLQQL